MSKEEFNQQAQNIVERGKVAVAEGNQRHLVLRKQDGTQVFETTLTMAAGVGLFLLVTGLLSWPIILIAAITAYTTKVKVEVRHDGQALSE